MDAKEALIPLEMNLEGRRIGPLQSSGPMSVLPILGEDAGDRFLPPLSGLKLSRVEGYGNVEMECLRMPDGDGNGAGGVGIVPLHIGYIQDGAQNHAMCRSAFMGAGQKVMFRDACCVQASQGGYLEGRDQWFFILPLQLRDLALGLRGQEGYSKLWPAITELNGAFGYPNRGHLEQIICRQRFYLTQYVSRMELLPDQVGAVFLINGKLAGVELAPSARYFEETWMPLACFCYGTAAMYLEEKEKKKKSNGAKVVPFEADSLAALSRELVQHREAAQQRALDAVASAPSSKFQTSEEERYLDLSLLTATSEHFSGQLVEEDGRLVYASLAAKSSWLQQVVH